ncbi:cytochrome b5 [Cystobasidium minutum MCA 4210]|uniref:cytochrome b5 n=1 Tax=Cystobasidium minutum MCA 4210 TaxID=1397322 RepID=UPI0034CD712A|eukprot:jgi/Rhomi1/184612/fgenesh1_pm.10_\
MLGSSLNLPPSTTVKPRKQRFVALEPGYSPLDWARLNKEGDDYELRYGYDKPQKFTLQEVSEHSTKNDAWSIFNGKVYNITPYLHYHPGGVGELMKCAGKDGTELFMKTHAWVNVELMMEGCLIGFLVRE